MAVEILRTLGPLGAEIGGLDLRLPLEASAVAAITAGGAATS